jgi:hypothetical protein
MIGIEACPVMAFGCSLQIVMQITTRRKTES